MAKRKGPTRPCVKCGKPIHPRQKLCSCGAEQPVSEKDKANQAARSVAARARLEAQLGNDELPPALQPTVSEFMRDMRKVMDKYGAETVSNFAKMLG